MILTALDAVDQRLRLWSKASDFCELMPRVYRQTGMRTEDHEPLGQMPTWRFLG